MGAQLAKAAAASRSFRKAKSASAHGSRCHPAARGPGVTGSSSPFLCLSVLSPPPLPLKIELTHCTRGCVTPKQFVNIRAKLTPDNGTLDITSLEGYDDLSANLQTKVKDAIEQGHVADADWKGVSSLLFKRATAQRV